VDSIDVLLSFKDKATNIAAHDATSKFMTGPFNPNEAIRFDVDTGYTKAQENQFQYLKGIITA